MTQEIVQAYESWIQDGVLSKEYLWTSLGGSSLASVNAQRYESPVIARARAKGRRIIEWPNDRDD